MAVTLDSYFNNYSEVIRMNENIENIEIEANSFQDLCNRLGELEKENEELKARTDFLQRCIVALKLNNGQLTKERNQVIEKNLELQRELCHIKDMGMLEFGNTYCSTESLEADGKAFAKALLGGK